MPQDNPSTQPGERWKAEVTSFIEKSLTWRSSHPRFARRKAKCLWRAPMISVAAIVSFILWQGGQFELRVLIDALQGKSWVFLLLLCIGVFVVSAVATAILSIRASATSGLDVLKNGDSTGPLPIKPLLVLVGGAALAGGVMLMLPKWIPPGLADPGKAVKYAFIAVFLPYVLTLALFDLYTPGQKRSRFYAFCFLFFLIVAGSLLMVSTNAEASVKVIAKCNLAKLPSVGPWIASLTGAAAQVFFRAFSAAVSFVAVIALGEWTLSGIPGDDQKSNEKQTEKQSGGVLRRLVAYIGNLFRPKSSAESEEAKREEKKEVAQWFDELCNSLKDRVPGAMVVGHLKLFAKEVSPNPSPLAADTSRNLLFGGVHPTGDQFKALELFLDRGRSTEPDNLVHREPVDLLLEGENGVGKTTTLIACALETLLIKGERAAIFAPDSTSRKQMLETAKRWLEGLQVRYFFDVDELSPARLQEWLVSPKSFPDILISSPQDWENSFFGEACDERKPHGQDGLESGVQLRHWLNSFTAFLVDDVANHAWTVQSMTHLPFIIDKQRLLQAAAGRRLQLLATTTRLDEKPELTGGQSPVREALMARLFGELQTPKVGVNYTIIRKWQRFEPDRAEIGCIPIEPVLFHLIRLGLRLDKQVILYLPEGDPEQRDSVRDEFRARMREYWQEHPEAPASADQSAPLVALDDSAENVRLVCHVNQDIFDADDRNRERILIYRGRLDDNIRPQLFSRYGSENTVVIALDLATRKEKETSPCRPMGFPLLVAREAAPLMVAHLRSAAVHFRVGVPMPRDDFAAYGVARPGSVPRPNPLWTAVWRRDRIMRFRVDPADVVQPAYGAADDDAWPMVCFAPEESESRDVLIPSRKVDFSHLSAFGLMYHSADGGNTLEFGDIGDRALDQRRARWVAGGRELQVLDLAFADELVALRGDEKFWCRSPHLDKSGRIIFPAEPYRGLATESTVPIWRVKLKRAHPYALLSMAASDSIPTGAKRSDVFLGVYSYSRPASSVTTAQLYPITEDFLTPEGEPGRSTLPQSPFTAEVSIEGAMPPDSRSRSTGFSEPARFSYPAAVTALLFDVVLPTDKKRWRALTDLLAYDWDTQENLGGGQFWPELTLAMQTGLRQFAPRFTQLCRLAGFRLNGGGAVLFFIEPLATAGTMEPVLKVLLDYPSFAREKVVDPAGEALKSGAWSGPGFTQEAALDEAGAERILKMLSGTRFRVPV